MNIDNENWKQITEDNIKLAYACANKLHRQWPKVDLDETIQICSIGLIKASQTYKEGQSAFSTYAYIIMYNEFRMNNRKLKCRENLQYVSIDEQMHENLTLEDMIADEDTDMRSIYDDMDIEGFITKLGLSPLDRTILTSQLKGINQKDIGDKLNFSQSYISRRLKDIKKQIKEYLIKSNK